MDFDTQYIDLCIKHDLMINTHAKIFDGTTVCLLIHESGEYIIDSRDFLYNEFPEYSIHWIPNLSELVRMIDDTTQGHMLRFVNVSSAWLPKEDKGMSIETLMFRELLRVEYWRRTMVQLTTREIDL